ncbi:MAG: helix-turn-helix transcriptional regulator [Bacteroidia bacterium]|nr:helix-turn-helix transcriptional regulator [Bacteroidia bacterium]
MKIKELGKKIWLMRTINGLSQENIAGEIGISATAWSKIERGETNVPFTRLVQIAAYFGLSVVELLEKSEPQAYKSKTGKKENKTIAVEPPSKYDSKNENELLKKEIKQLRELLKAKDETIELLKNTKK